MQFPNNFHFTRNFLFSMAVKWSWHALWVNVVHFTWNGTSGDCRKETLTWQHTKAYNFWQRECCNFYSEIEQRCGLIRKITVLLSPPIWCNQQTQRRNFTLTLNQEKTFLLAEVFFMFEELFLFSNMMMLMWNHSIKSHTNFEIDRKKSVSIAVV